MCNYAEKERERERKNNSFLREKTARPEHIRSNNKLTVVAVIMNIKNKYNSRPEWIN